jgi:very-short-patch-repair endonuclease
MTVGVSTNSDLLKEKIEKWKRDLIDLTNRNVLLNFRPKKNNSLELLVEPQMLFDQLVKNSKKLNVEDINNPYFEQIKKIMDSKEEESVKQKKVREERERFTKLVAKLRLTARTRLNEQGIQTLYLVFGILKWKEKDNSKDFISPLLLVPVELNRSSANQPFQMKIVDEEIVLNPFMAHKLREEKGIVFPELGDSEELELKKVWNVVSKQVKSLEGWSVSPNLYLSLFSFSKLVMYKDLENYRDLLESHPLIRTISGIESTDNVELMDLSSIPDEASLDREIPSEESYQVLDADSSQQQAIIAAKKGVSFVLQGPPGTGKSQTISNIIAECLASNKKVLFVSEKMAALEVVKSRLEIVGLGDFCLELHSHKANKKSVLDAFQKTMDKLPKRKQIKNELYSNINLVRNQLNTYSEKLHQIREPFGKSVYEIHGALARLDGVQEMLFDFDINEPTDFEYILSLLKDLERYRKNMIFVENTPIWVGFSKQVYSLEMASNVESIINELIKNISMLSKKAQSIQKTLGLNSDSIEGFRQNLSIIEMAKYSPRPPKHLFEHKTIPITIKNAKEYQEKMTDFIENKRALTQLFQPEIISLEMPKIYNEMFPQSVDLFKIFDSKDPIVIIQERVFIEKTIELGTRSLQTIIESQKVQEEFGLPPMKRIKDVLQLNNYMSCLVKKPHPTKAWFDDLKGVQESIQVGKQMFLNLEQKRDLLYKQYDPSILELNLFILKQSLEKQGSELIPLFVSSKPSTTDGDEVYSRQLSIQERIDKFLALQEQFEHAKSIITEMFETDLSDVKSVTNMKSIIELIAKDPRPTTHWFNMDKQHELNSFLQESKIINKKYQMELSATLELYEEEVLDERLFEMLERFETTYQSPMRVFIGDYNRDRKWLGLRLKQKEKFSFDSLYKHVRTAKRVLEHKKWLDEKQSESRSFFGRHYKGTETQWNQIEELLYINQEIQQMFPGSKVPPGLEEILIQSAGRLEQLISAYEGLNIISYNLKEVLLSLRTDFPTIFLKWSALPVEQWPIKEVTEVLKDIHNKLQNFYSNTQTLLNCRKAGTLSELYLNDLLKDIDLALSVVQIKNQIIQHEPSLKELMGKWYKSEQTPWEAVEQALFVIEELKSSTSYIPEKFQSYLIEDNFALGDRCNKFQDAVNQIKLSINDLKEKIPLLFNDFPSNEINQWDITQLMNQYSWLFENIQKWYRTYDEIVPYIKNEYSSTEELNKDLQHIILVKEQKKLLDSELTFLKGTFGNLFSGYTTNWDIIFDALAWIEEWMQHFNGKQVPDSLLNYISEGSTSEQNQELRDLFIESSELFKESERIYYLLRNYFDDDSLQVDGEDLNNCSFVSIQSWLIKRAESMDQLDEWIRYQRLERRLEDVHLSSYLKYLKKEKPTKGSFPELFKKRFYRKWLDSIYQVEGILYDFEGDRANETILKFCEDDLKSLDQNALRVQQILEKKRNHSINGLAYRREQGILLHEIGKKKRHIAIRKLLSQTSNLAMEIKPCFLMSPLSVSQYLDANDITFDVVIFDEASQIFPEDAIGSIIRASQVIIVGDNKQLPPTDFFRSGGGDDEFEDENEVNYESILDECMYILQSMRLGWHYRSRHESLISFSNSAFYSNSLITFPSAEHGDELGVKFVHVPDGMYDRGGTRSNQREAEITAELVFEHIRKSPDRSLGIIAFSDAQATEIREQIDHLRRKNPSMEQFFKEDHKDEFFVKSLENVQGDERDVIFFSIGYGKASDGSLHMNFGPLTKNGGERRLNVAITRAKYHVKLISSLLPQDIPLERTQSLGVHRLRDYMEMARSGHLPTYSTSDNIKLFDSPFEEDVYDALIEMGYEVHTQVGASGYKIDLAVVDPNRPDSYLCGIECDGKTYHSSKVARDRDRLRQQVLENLGWKIHRIWSQEWFKKKKFEITRLENLLGKLVNK